MRFTFDTNILVYSADVESGIKHETAEKLLHRAAKRDCFFILQCLGEFYFAVTRKGVTSLDRAETFVGTWKTIFPVFAANEDCLANAMFAVREHRLSFWDAMIWATAREAGGQVVFSEDFQDGQTLDGVTFINPFLERNATLLAAVLPLS